MSDNPITYDEILNYCVQALAFRDAKTDDAMNQIIDQFSSMPNWDGDALLKDLKLRFEIIIGSGGVLKDEGHQPWLEAKREVIDPFYWTRYHRFLSSEGFPPNPLAEIDKNTDRILGLLDDPTRPGPWDRRGMVIGHVQSGKTANYIGLINKAADAGYKVIIVIAGIHNSLRNQTQRRIDEGFRGIASADIKKAAGHHFVGVGDIDPSRQPSSFTSTIQDFNKATAQTVGQPLYNLTEPAVFVIKKNANTLRALIDWLRQYSGIGLHSKIDEPLLIIDDEADNASINTSANPDNATKINGLIRELLQTFTRSAYVGYTATPFANVFVDPATDDEMIGRDLFPRDFIASLDAPSNYFGPVRIFDGSEPSPVIREVEDIEESIPAVHRKDYAPAVLPASLKAAIRAFILATAIRMVRGQGSGHSSMLVNVSRYINTQRAVEKLINNYIAEIKNQIRLYGHLQWANARKYSHISKLHETFLEEYSALSTTSMSWDEVFPILWQAVAPIQVITVNSKSSDSLNYEQHQQSGLRVIAVGGDSLSRGLTLEGLSISYFSRSSKQYDTLMQMGRWFGYRTGYEDLCRVWLPTEMISWFEHITEAIEELRSDLLQMQQANATPREFGLRVRQHPGALLITARNKMRSGESVRVKMSLTKTFIETARLISDTTALESNILAARNLTLELVSSTTITKRAIKGTTVFENVSADYVVAFLHQWRNLPASYRTAPEPLIQFITERREELGLWDVAFPGLQHEGRSVPAHLSALEIRMQERTLGDRDTSREIRIGSKLRIMSPSDEQIGLTPHQLQIARELANARGIDSKKNIPGVDIRSARSRPLLLVHYLDLLHKNKSRAFEGPVIGWSMSFPGSTDPGEPVEYLVNRTFFEDFILDGELDEELED